MGLRDWFRKWLGVQDAPPKKYHSGNSPERMAEIRKLRYAKKAERLKAEEIVPKKINGAYNPENPINRNMTPWLERDDAYVVENWRNMTDYEMAEKLFRTTASVQQRRHILQLKHRNQSGGRKKPENQRLVNPVKPNETFNK